ncbi:MAG: vitamin B12-dependent ribonucleotide reductase [Dethiobacteria bacterium]
MKLSPSAKAVLERRYLKKDGQRVLETPEDMLWRVAENIAAVDRDVYGESEEHLHNLTKKFFEMMDKRLFMPNSPTLMNAGRELQQLSACFVLPVEDSMESIFETIKNAALIHKSGGGTGFSFSRLRPKKDIVKSTGGVASGPISFLKVFNAATEAVKQGGTRRGANMGILRVDHPDILEFVTAKKDLNEITNFNLSVGITNRFMEALQNDEEYPLINPRNGEITAKLKAREVFDLIVEMAWLNGEPGIIFLDRINEDNPTPALGEIESTNPCGEQPLLPYESCNLGSINLSQVASAEKGIDWELLRETVHTAVHFLDNVIDANNYPLPEIEKLTKATRKIGLGVMGWGDLLYKLKIPYNSEEALQKAEEVASFINEESKKASANLAEKRGFFPYFKGSTYEKKGFPPLRNATTTTIAPTGTISIICGTSSGIEPLFALAFRRNIMDNDLLLEVNPVFEEEAKKSGFYSRELMEKIAQSGSIQGMEEIPQRIREVFVTAHEIEPEWHLRMQAVFQKHTDNAVSKTVNLPREATREDVAKIYKLAYTLSCKGVTIYRDQSREQQVLQKGTLRKEKETKRTARKEIAPRPRPDVTKGQTERVRTGCGNLYVTINEDENGLCELFASMGKSGGCAASQSEAIARLISMALRSGLKVSSIIKELRGIRCPNPTWQKGGGMVLSCPDAIGIVLDHYIQWKKTGERPVQNSKNGMDNLDTLIGACPECGGAVKHESGCITCYYCGFSRCS